MILCNTLNAKVKPDGGGGGLKTALARVSGQPVCAPGLILDMEINRNGPELSKKVLT